MGPGFESLKVHQRKTSKIGKYQLFLLVFSLLWKLKKTVKEEISPNFPKTEMPFLRLFCLTCLATCCFGRHD